MMDWLRVYLAPLPLCSYSLAGLFLLALDTRLQQRGVWRWLGARWAAVQLWWFCPKLVESMEPISQATFEAWQEGGLKVVGENVRCRRPRPKPEDIAKKLKRRPKKH